MVAVLVLALGLAMDAFSVSVSYGVCHPDAKWTSGLRLAFFTGLFQFFMPLLGWLGGNLFGSFLGRYGAYIAALVLFIIGIKMLIDFGIKTMKKEACNPCDITRGRHLVGVCIATSIDAFAAGLSFGILEFSLLFTAATIGVVTFVLSLTGVYIGRFVGLFVGKFAEVVGGVILIAIGVKILLEQILA
jgi:putative Mn2+ efflux pump MntP